MRKDSLPGLSLGSRPAEIRVSFHELLCAVIGKAHGELAIFEPGEVPVTFEGAEGTGATFVLGSAVPHPYELHLGAYSVHTSADALAAGERHLRELKKRLDATGDRRTASGSTPVFRG